MITMPIPMNELFSDSELIDELKEKRRTLLAQIAEIKWRSGDYGAIHLRLKKVNARLYKITKNEIYNL
jgi:chorismate mutase